MNEEDLLRLQDELERRIEMGAELPFGGLFGDTVLAEVIEEIVADPLHHYRLKDLESILERSKPPISAALQKLTSLNLLENISTDPQHPLYRVNMGSKRLMALTFLAYAIHDDNERTTFMDNAIAHYYESELRERYEPFAFTDNRIFEYRAPIIGEIGGLHEINEELLAPSVGVA